MVEVLISLPPSGKDMRDGLVTLPSLGQTAGVLQLVSEMLHSLTLLMYLAYYGFRHLSSPRVRCGVSRRPDYYRRLLPTSQPLDPNNICFCSGTRGKIISKIPVNGRNIDACSAVWSATSTISLVDLNFHSRSILKC